MEKEKLSMEELHEIAGGRWQEHLNKEENAEYQQLMDEVNRMCYNYGPFSSPYKEAVQRLVEFGDKMAAKYGE